MTLRLPGYPSIFYQAGYRVESIEREFDVTHNGQVREVKFDLVLNNLHKNHSVAFECKSGGTDPDQLQKYSHLSPEELVLVGKVSSNDPSTHTNDIAIVFNKERIEQIFDETQHYRFVLTAISRNPTTIQVVGPNEFQDDDLQPWLTTPVPYPEVVSEVFRVGGQTPLFKYIILVAEELVAQSISGTVEFGVADLAPGVVSLYPGLYPAKIGHQLRQDIGTKIERVLREGSTYELKGFFDWDRKTKRGRMKRLHPGCKSVTYKAFEEQAREMAERIRLGTPVPDKYLSKPQRLPKEQLTLKIPDDE